MTSTTIDSVPASAAPSQPIGIMSWWLGVGLVLTSATMLRFIDLPIGIGELMLLSWLPLGLTKISWRAAAHRRPIVAATVVFFCVTCVILLLGAAMAWRHGEFTSLARHSLAAYLFSAVLVSTFCLQPDVERKVVELSRVLAVVGIPLFAFLFLCAQLPRAINGGYSVFYFMGVRFSALSINPNQFALFALTLLFLGAFYVRRDNQAIPHWGRWIMLLIVAGLAGVASRSNALLVGMIIGVVLLGAFARSKLMQREVTAERTFIATVLVALAVWHVAPYVPSFHDIDLSKLVPSPISRTVTAVASPVSRVVTAVASHIPVVQPDGELSVDTVKNARLAAAAYEVSEVERLQATQRMALWKNGLQAFMEAPFIGNGPGHFSGFHGPFEGKEAHNTLIDWGASTGIIGLLALAAWAAILAWQAWRRHNLLGLCGMAALVMFAQFHFVLRQPIFWFAFVLLALLPAAHDEAKA